MLVDDNFHYMDEEYRYKLGPFDDYESAEAKCKEIVDEFLQHNYQEGMRAEDLWILYVTFGEDPWIPTGDGIVHFSAWDYAKRRCNEICDEESPPPG